MQITFLTHWYPFPADNGAKQRTAALLQAIAREHCIDLVILGAEPVGSHPESLTKLCRTITVIPDSPWSRDTTPTWRSLLSRVPRFYMATFNPEVIRIVEGRIAARQCDMVVCGELAALYGLRLATAIPVIVDELDPSRYVDAIRRTTTLPQRLRAVLRWWKYRAFARRIVNVCAGCLVASEREAALLRRLAAHPDRVAIVPNGVALASAAVRAQRDAFRIVYNGAPAYGPNLEAVAFFADEILPRIRMRIPEAWLAVTGHTDGVPLDILKGLPDIVFTGWLSDIRTYVSTSRVCAVPLREGGGTRLKILEAMALGTPVIATSKGAEGLAVTDGEDIFITDDPDAFADLAVRLIREDDLHARIAARARETIAARYDWEKIGEELRATICRLVGMPM